MNSPDFRKSEVQHLILNECDGTTEKKLITGTGQAIFPANQE